jgi:hypothetical protein
MKVLLQFDSEYWIFPVKCTELCKNWTSI